MVIETVRQLREKLLTKEIVAELDKKEIFPEKIIKELLSEDIGLQLLFIPEEYGGIGGGARDCCEVTSEMAQICLGIATAFFAIQLGADPLLVGGTEAQKEKWLKKITNEKNLVAYAVTEPDAGSNVAAIKTKADPVTDDSGKITGYIVNGVKQFISTGGYADFITLLANTPEGPTFFIVEKKTKGFSAGKGEEKHGIRASNTAPLSFTDLFLPMENLVGEVTGQGLKQANAVFGYTRLMVAAMAYGAGKAAIDIAINYAKERFQFGTVLSEKQGYTHKLLLPNIVRLEAAKAYIDEIALRLDCCDNPEKLQVEGSIAKFFTTEAANKAAEDAMQALGGYGYISEFEVEKIKRDVKITCIYEGTSEIQQNIISTFRWKKTWKTKGGYYEEMAKEANAFDTAEAGYYSLCANAVNTLINAMHRKKLTKKQYLMFTLADMITELEVGMSLMRKSISLSKTDNKKKADKIATISTIFANRTAAITADGILKIVLGSGSFEKDEAKKTIAVLEYEKLTDSYRNIIGHMDRLNRLIMNNPEI